MPVKTEPAFIAFPSLSVVADIRRWRRSGCFPFAIADRSGRSRSSSSGGGIRRGGGLGGAGGGWWRLDLPTVIATGFGAGSSGKDDEVGPATCEADACIDATSWRCRTLFAVAEGGLIVISYMTSSWHSLVWETRDERREKGKGTNEPSRSRKSASRWKLCMSAEYRLTCQPICAARALLPCT